MAKQHAPTSTTLTPTPAVRAGVAPEQQPAGNAAMQEAMEAQNEQGAEGGLFDDLLAWGWEQVGGVDDLLAYAAEAGLEAALIMVEDLAAYAPKVLEQLLAQITEVDELAWAAFEALGSVVVLQLLPAGQVALLLGAIVERHADWALEQLQRLDPAALKGLFAGLDRQTLERLAAASTELFLAALDAVWQPGLGISLAVEAEASLAFEFACGLGFAARLTLRHLGQGAFELERTISADENLGIGHEAPAGETKLVLGQDGYLRDLSVFDHRALRDPAATFLTLAQPSAAALAAFLPGGLNAFVKELELGNGAYIEASAEAEGGQPGGEVGTALSAQIRGDLSATFTDIEEGRLHARLEASMQGLIAWSSSAAVGGDLTAGLSEMKDMGAETLVALDADVRLTDDGLPFFENTTLSVTNAVDLGDTEVAIGLAMEEPWAAASLEEYLQQVVSLNVRITTGAAHAAARAWLDQAQMLESFGGGAWALSAEATLEVTLDAEAVTFIAQVVADHLAAVVGSDRLLDELVAWGMNPLEKTPPQALQLLMTEIAMATDLQLTLTGTASRGSELGVGQPGGSGELGGELAFDLEKDLLAMGAIVTVDQVGELLKGEAAGRDVQLGA